MKRKRPEKESGKENKDTERESESGRKREITRKGNSKRRDRDKKKLNLKVTSNYGRNKCERGEGVEMRENAVTAWKTGKNARRRALPQEETERKRPKNPQEKDKKHLGERKREEEERGEANQEWESKGKGPRLKLVTRRVHTREKKSTKEMAGTKTWRRKTRRDHARRYSETTGETQKGETQN